jgi:molybdopterin/thiamine biosynthesis adenylyltransferase
METSRHLHACFLALFEFEKKENRQPKVWSLEDAEAFLKLFKSFWTEEVTEQIEKFVRMFSMVCKGSLPPLCAFWGGFVSQEIIKAITQKYKPTKSLFFTECSELIQDLPEDFKNWPETIKKINSQISEKPSRANGFEIIVGKEVLSKIESSRLFMIGAGAIGCELLKNFAMINLSVAEKGMIFLTDPDHIETSNLNRQFLFREKHLRKPKSSTAAASVLQMNPLLKGHIAARLDKVHDGTK